MIKRNLIIMLLVSFFLFSCGGGYNPTPRLINRTFEVEDTCTHDFSVETGLCVAVEDGVQKDCNRIEDECVEHFYVTRINGKSTFIMMNVLLPCYVDWLTDKYNDVSGDYYQHGDYRVVDFSLGSPVDNPRYVQGSVVHLILQTHSDELQAADAELTTCYYRVEATMKNLIGGSYSLKLWDEDRELILETDFDH